VTKRMRRRLIFCALVVALTLPVESVLLQAVTTTDPNAAALRWASALSPESLEQVADQVEAFPQYMRRAIMTALPADSRSRVWRNHVARYITAHPDLDGSTVALLQAAMALASPENLSAPTADSRAQVRLVGDQIEATIGREDALYLLYRLGPADGTFTSLEPLSLKVSNWVRAEFAALAAGSNCDCNQSWGCGSLVSCTANSGCAVQDSWPACGWLWDDPCDGLCKTVITG
jgi:hypothetical protein